MDTDTETENKPKTKTIPKTYDHYICKAHFEIRFCAFSLSQVHQKKKVYRVHGRLEFDKKLFILQFYLNVSIWEEFICAI